jgi:hypothetical protein
VLPGSTFYPYVRCLACRGVLGGYTDGTFRPGNDLTRGQLAKIVSNAAGLSDPVSGQSFEDVGTESPFYVYVERMYLHRILSGYPCGGQGEPCGPDDRPYFRPNTSANRGQISKIVAASAGLVGRGDSPEAAMFEDVTAENPYYIFVQALASRGHMSGYPCGGQGEPCGSNNRPYFRPYNNTTRGQAAKIIANAFSPNCVTP